MSTRGKEVEGYKDLGMAIVEQAVHDYKNLYRVKKPHWREAYKKRIIRFLHSDWCYMLCGIDRQVWDKFIIEYDNFQGE